MIQPQYMNLEQMFSRRVFRIPIYQRCYSWQEHQRKDLFQDIDRIIAESKEHHFMATIVCFDTKECTPVKSKEYQTYDLVDGQQRMTTLILLLKAISMKLPEEKDKQELQDILVKEDGHLILLQTNNSNQQIFNSYIRDGRHPKNDDIKTHADKNLAKAFRECERFVDKYYEVDKIFELSRAVRNRLGFVVYDTQDPKAVYTVFEVLNSRGLPVDWLDKAKSVLMGRAYELAPNEDVRRANIEELNSLWGQIYAKLALYPIHGDEVLRVAMTIRYGQESARPIPAERALDLCRIVCCIDKDAIIVSQWLYDVASQLVSLYENRVLGHVTRILHARILAVSLQITNSLNESERERAIAQWERSTFRIYGLLRKDSRTKVGDFVRLAHQIFHCDKTANTYQLIMHRLRELCGETIEDAVKEGLEQKNCYENTEVTQYVLWRYEEHLCKKNKRTTSAIDQKAIWEDLSSADSIEHIAPQHPELNSPWLTLIGEDEYEFTKNRIGNLILLPQPLNSEAKRHPFHNKKVAYQKSSLEMVKEIVSENEWNKEKIEKREAEIIKWATETWRDLCD